MHGIRGFQSLSVWSTFASSEEACRAIEEGVDVHQLNPYHLSLGREVDKLLYSYNRGDIFSKASQEEGSECPTRRPKLLIRESKLVTKSWTVPPIQLLKIGLENSTPNGAYNIFLTECIIPGQGPAFLLSQTAASTALPLTLPRCQSTQNGLDTRSGYQQMGNIRGNATRERATTVRFQTVCLVFYHHGYSLFHRRNLLKIPQSRRYISASPL